MHTALKSTILAIPLIGILLTGLTACTPHERFHHTLGRVHDDFHQRPHSPAEHHRLHENLGDLHEEYHERDYDNQRYYRGRYYPYGY